MAQTATDSGFVRRIIFSLLKPATWVADRFGLSMKDLTALVQRAYLETKRRKGLTIGEIGEELGMSARTVDRLGKSMREDFFQPEQDHELPRRVEFMLWSNAMSEARIRQLLREASEDDIAGALALLLEEGRVELQSGRTPQYVATRHANRLPDSSEAARVDGLNNMMRTMGDTVTGRFFDDDMRAAARSVALRVRPADLPKIEALYEQHVWTTLVALDAAAEHADDAVEVGVVVCWAPRNDHDTL